MPEYSGLQSHTEFMVMAFNIHPSVNSGLAIQHLKLSVFAAVFA